jgi:hypothetical protein
LYEFHHLTIELLIDAREEASGRFEEKWNRFEIVVYVEHLLSIPHSHQSTHCEPI